ncbi:ankyrin, partial [Amniculicola lignicola CBS 123094]
MGSQKRLEEKDQVEEKVEAVVSDAQRISQSLRSSLQLLAAAETGNVELVQHLVQEIISRVDGNTSRFLVTALFIAVAFGHASIAEALVLGGVNINAKGLHGQTVLHVATRRNDVIMVKMLLDRGADVRAKDDNGYTPWMANVHTEKLETVSQLLLAAGTDVNDENNIGMSTLYTAAAGNHLSIVEFL